MLSTIAKRSIEYRNGVRVQCRQSPLLDKKIKGTRLSAAKERAPRVKLVASDDPDSGDDKAIRRREHRWNSTRSDSPKKPVLKELESRCHESRPSANLLSISTRPRRSAEDAHHSHTRSQKPWRRSSRRWLPRNSRRSQRCDRIFPLFPADIDCDIASAN